MKHLLETWVASLLIEEEKLFLIINKLKNEVEMCNFILIAYFNLLAYIWK